MRIFARFSTWSNLHYFISKDKRIMRISTLKYMNKALGLKNDLQACRFAYGLFEAVQKLEDVQKTGNSLALAFHEFAYLWVDYTDMPEESQNRCNKLVNLFRDMWDGIATLMVFSFRQQLISVKQGEDDASYDDLCMSCVELIDATSFSKGNIPHAVDLLSDALNLIQNDEISVPSTCKALLYVLCSNIMEYCFLNTECEKTFLLEGVHHHMRANSDCAFSLTDKYAEIIANAICNIAILNMEKNTIGNEFPLLVSEGYAVLSAIDPDEKEYYEAMLYITCGISKLDALAIRRSILQKKINMEMVN